MKSLFGRRSAIASAAIAAALVLSGCSSSVNDAAGGGSGDCGSYAIECMLGAVTQLQHKLLQK